MVNDLKWVYICLPDGWLPPERKEKKKHYKFELGSKMFN